MSCTRRTNYSDAWNQGFAYALKMRDRSIPRIDPEEPFFNPFDHNTDEHDDFECGYRDGIFTSGFHQLN